MAKEDTARAEIISNEKNAVTLSEGDVSTKGTTEFENDAALGTQQEKDMPLATAFRYYRKAAIWSVLICMSSMQYYECR